MRYFALLFLAAFTWFAWLQLNDPDPIWWTTLYLIPAYVSWEAFRGRYSFELLRVLIVLYSAYAITSWMGMTQYEGFFTEGAGMEMKTPNQELAREASGLGICIGVYIIYSIAWYVQKRKAAEPKVIYEAV